MYCEYGTYTGDDVGIHDQTLYSSEFNHHIVLLGTNTPAALHPDGEVVDCTDPGAMMADFAPVFISGVGLDGSNTWSLPDGMATKLRTGQRYVIQVHYVNTSGDRIEVQDAETMSFVPVDDVTTWAAPFVMNSDRFDVPPQQSASESFECTLDQDLDFLFILGHMHEWGTAFSIKQLGDVDTTLLDIPEWDPSFRDLPPTQQYEPGTMMLPSGTRLQTNCEWSNTTDDDLTFPKEMCVGVSMVYPALTPVICDAGSQ